MVRASKLLWCGMALLALVVNGCAINDSEQKIVDGASVADKGPGTIDSKAVPDQGPLTAYKVAAVQYGEGNYSAVKGCTSDLCGLEHHVREAAKNRALLVVVPEYSAGQGAYEASPAVGDTPTKDPRWPAGSIIRTFAALADELNITLVFNLITRDSADKIYNTNLAVDPQGKVVARHYKFQLFAGEASKYTPGSSVSTSFFETPAGKVGMLICADAQCIVTNLYESPDCSSHAIGQLKAFFAQKPHVVLFSALWTVGPSNPSWYSIAVQSKIAKGAAVWVVGANTTSGAGYGGGIFNPKGEEVATHKSPTPKIVYADLPLKK